MTSLDDIQQAILRLRPEELAELRAWFAASDDEDRDREIAEDIAAGRLDMFAEDALAETRAGRSRRL